MQISSAVTRQLKEQELMLKTLLSSIPSGVISTDAQGLVTQINPVAEALIGVSSSESVGKPLEKSLKIADRKLGQHITGLLTKSHSHKVDWAIDELVLIDREHNEIPIRCKVSPIKNNRGSLMGFVIVLEQVLDRGNKPLGSSDAEIYNLFAGMEDFIFVMNREGRYLEVLSAHSELDNHLHNKSNKTLHEVLPQHLADYFLREICETADTQTAKTIEYVLSIRGQEVWFSTTISPISEDTVTWIARDISDRKRTEMQLHRLNQEVEARFRQHTEDFLTVNSQLVNALEERGRIEAKLRRHLERLEMTYQMAFDLNQASTLDQVYAVAIASVRKIFQSDRSAILMQDEQGHIRYQLTDGISKGYQQIAESFFMEHFSPRNTAPRIIPDIELKPELAPLREAIRAEGFRSLGVFTLIHQDRTLGEIAFYYDRPYNFSDEEIQLGKAIASYVGMAISRKQAEEALRESERRYQVLFNSKDDAVFVHRLNPELRAEVFLEVNEAACECLGYTREELLQMSPQDIVPPEVDHFPGLKVIEKLLSTKQAFFETTHVSKDGRKFPVEVRANLFDYNGKPAIMAFAHDISKRKEIEEALRKSEARNRAILNTLPDLLLLLKRDGSCLECIMPSAPSTLNECEYLPVRKHISEVLPPEILVEQVQIFDRAIATGEVQVYEHQIPKFGRLVYEEVRVAPYGEEEVLVIVRDISDRKQAEQALKESEEKYRILFDAIEDSVFVYPQGSDVKFLEVNDSACRSLGYTREELLAKSPRDIIPPYFHTNCPKSVKSPDGKHFVFEVIHVRKDGSEFPVEVAGMTFEFKGESMVMGIARNISDRKQAEEKLRNSEAALAEAQRVAHMGNWERELVTNRNTWSDQLFHIWGFSLEEPTPSFNQILERVNPEDRLRLKQAVEGAVATNSSFEIDYKILLPDGTSKWLYSKGHGILGADGKPMKIYGITQDITERKQAEKLRLELEREKEISALRVRFFSMMSHEFRTPLAVITNAAHLLKLRSDSSLENKSIQKQVNYIESSTKRLVSIMNNVLTINRAEVGKLEFNPQPLQVDKYCRQIVTEMLLSIGNQQRIHYQNHCKLQKANLDRRILDSILSNLLSNALKYSPENTTVILELDCHATVTSKAQSNQRTSQVNHKNTEVQTNLPEQAYIIFRVCDRGIGISPMDQKHIFDPFYRAKNSEMYEGTGLGLSIVKQYVEAHHGKISVKSEIGVGTTFTVTLPL
ncbi:PAS domain S-box protein [Tumidithrix elongata RA019]|uniref:histidine kinase n=1 Tax=Tumidithrix elongata BACA0141 TaxID=2716417 RepID=A0AAW9Q5D0_9CYAN|nr:PAS domain S-box protein [Tumidithrix elongata RA019]